MSIPELKLNITPLKVNDEYREFTNARNLSTPISPTKLPPNSVPASPLVALHQSLSTSNGAYPDTSRALAQEKANSGVSGTDQSSSVTITDADDEFESNSSAESQQQTDANELRRLRKQLRSANDKNNEKDAEKIQRQIDTLTKRSDSPKSNIKSKKITPSLNENIDGRDPAPFDNKRNSSLLSPEKLKNLVETVDRNKINKIDGLIQRLKNNADQLEEKLKKLKNKDVLVGGDDYLDQIRSIENTLRKTRQRIDRLKDKSEHIERRVLPGAKTHNEIMEECKKILEDCKSDKTRALDKKYDEMVKELTEQNEQSNYTRAKIGVAGASAFSASFFIGNTWSRAVDMSPYIPPFISGTLHVITATPVAKAIMPSSWTSPALSALNNNFKLRGDSWGDYWRQKLKGDSQGRQYHHRENTKLTGKITIEERLGEEPSFTKLLAARYKDEEASYYFYTLNYIFKAIGAGFVSSALGATTLSYRITEAVLHGICGAFSGAEYLLFQQFSRSRRKEKEEEENKPKEEKKVLTEAKNIPTLTRKIFAAKADALRSLQKDVEDTIKKYDSNPDHDASDPIHRLLIKASSKVNEDLRIATRQASMFGLLKHEFMTQFAHGNRLDTIAEILGRILSLMPSAAVNQLTTAWRKSSDPWLVFAAHTLSAIVLIAPPGFTCRPLYVGMIRACLQAMCNIYENKTTPENKTATVDDHDDDSSVGSVNSDDDWLDEYFDTRWHGNPTERDENAGL